MRVLSLLLPGAALVVGIACADGDVGILTVHITLEPVHVEVPPELSDVLDADAFAAGAGSIHTDVPTGAGTVEANELPELPEGLVYAPVLTLASGPRVGLPASSGGEAGHGHGVSEGGESEPAAEDGDHDDGEEDHEDDGGGSVFGDALQAVDDDSYVGLFSAEDLGELELGALRSGAVRIVSEDGSPLTPTIDGITVLAGAVDLDGEGSSADGSEEESAGHAHGV